MSSFTVRASGGRLRQLITDIGVCAAYDPENPPSPTPGMQVFKAVWDTGATSSVIDERVITQCGLSPVGMAQVNTALGSDMVEVYLVNFALPNHVGVAKVRVTRGKLGSGQNVLVGMDIIMRGDLAITHGKGNTVFTFCIPSTRELDFVAESKSPAPSSTIKMPPGVGRNSKCPCGSGKKYKHCCGAAT